MAEHGTIVAYNPDKKFGFIGPDWPDADDVFFHYSQMLPAGVTPLVGMRVAFRTEPSRNRPGRTCAVEIQVDEEQNVGPRETGTIKQFGHNYGFIERDSGGSDVFVHKTSCAQEPVAGARVSFRQRPGRGGRMAAFDVQPETKE